MIYAELEREVKFWFVETREGDLSKSCLHYWGRPNVLTLMWKVSENEVRTAKRGKGEL